MLLFGVSVKRRVAQVGFVAVLALVVSPIDIIFAAASTSSLLKPLILVAIGLPIIGGLFAVIKLRVSSFLVFLLHLGLRRHGLLSRGLWLNLV